MTPTMVIVGGGHDGLVHRCAIRNVANDSGGSDGCRDGVDIDRALYLGTKGWPEGTEYVSSKFDGDNYHF